MSEPIITIFDTTLRDGEQSPGASLSIHEKVEIAHQLARLNVDVIEAGFPVSSPAQFEAVELISGEVRGPVIAGLSRAVQLDIDRCWEAIQRAERPRIHTFIATSDIHISSKFGAEKYGRTMEEKRECILQMAVEAVKLAKSYTEDVEFSPEDAGRSDTDYLCRVVEATIDAGATTINIPDTTGYCVPSEFSGIIEMLFERVPNIQEAVISVHCHNDLGLAVANSLAAIVSGARQIECTINGLGERAGNAALEEVVMAMKVRKDRLKADTRIRTEEIYRTSRLVSHLTGFVVQPNKAIVGANAFAHESGIHQDGVLKRRETYEIMSPQTIGLEQNRLVLGRHSGRHGFGARLEALGYKLMEEDLQRAYERFLLVADKKKEVFDEDLAAIVEDEIHEVPERYKLEYLHTSSGTGTIPTATVKLRVGDDVRQTVALGDGPVDATYKALAAITDIPIKLEEYSIRAVTGDPEALGEAVIRIKDDGRTIIGRGVSTDIIEASAKAYIDGLNKLAVWRETKKTTETV
ncbi:MAG: 2-isopropylmalate synthase [Candidatus Latescibacteria bacterium]|nr:2-isopropylmalate synthase [Candidatus Latescibacterota bacterium]